ncbi:hypothetical protein AC578_51 [Pseudocercospora eumusae]|uniref:Uncharacterized protein n=1 Tax=Pseudocercospora eumusae TaxID=321146 RepID=A0A139HP57_9PEZI|nr:hypothetical protein AC578_51 [Pseudocercospora eumusae]
MYESIVPLRQLMPQEPAPPSIEAMRGKVEQILGKTTAAPLEDRIKAQHHRIQRGLLLYETCSSEELQVFCQQRGINLPRGCYRITRRARDEMIERLESADDNIIFHKYVDLPAELGLLVIESYMSSVPRVSLNDAPPPICGVSRTVRHDSLATFYQNRTLPLCYDLRGSSPKLHIISYYIKSRLCDSEVGYIRKYSIDGLFDSDSYSYFTLHIAKDGTGYQILDKKEPVLEREKRIVAKMVEQMKASLDGMLAETGKIVPATSDASRWVRMWERAWKDVDYEERVERNRIHRPLAGPPLPP